MLEIFITSPTTLTPFQKFYMQLWSIYNGLMRFNIILRKFTIGNLGIMISSSMILDCWIARNKV